MLKTFPGTEKAEPKLLRRIATLLATIVIAVALAFCFYASSLCIALIFSAFLAILIDPIVTRIERWRLPRSLSAAMVVVAAMAALCFLVYASYGKATSFIDALPEYAGRVHDIAKPLLDKVEQVQRSAGTLNPTPPAKRMPEVRINQEPSWPSYLVRGVGSVGGAFIMAAVVPFLTFFMLVRKEQIYSWVVATFGTKIEVPRFVNRLNQMIRGFVAGNLVIGAIMAVGTVTMLLAIGLQGAVALGIASAILNLIPFIGLILGALVLLMAAMLQFDTPAPFIIIALTVTSLHLISANLLTPKLIGARVNIGPVAATVGMLFWGWLWGAIGILLAIPLTAFVRIVADCHPALIHISNLLAEEPRPLPNWVQTGQSTAARAIPFFRKRSTPK